MTDEPRLAATTAKARSSRPWTPLLDWIGRRLMSASTRETLAAAEARASHAEALLREVIDAIPEGIVFLDADGRYVLWNKAYTEIYQRSADLIRPGVRMIDALRGGLARGGYPDAIGREEQWLAARMALLEHPGKRHEQQLADGRWLMIEERKTDDGGIIGLRVDITDMKLQAQALSLAESQARRAEARLREAIEAIPEGIVFLDAEGRYILWNQSYAEIYHRSADLFEPGARLVDTLRVGIARGDYPDAVGQEEEWLAARLALLENPGERHEQRLSDGRWLMIEERKTGEGGTIGLRVDITEMKRQAEALQAALERAEAANRAKTEFLANLSHEIRTPLNGVLGMADVLARAGLNDVQTEMVQTIAASAGALNQVLIDLLDFSRLESGALEIANEAFQIADVVAASAALFEEAARAKGLVLRVDIAEAVQRRVVGDPARLRQILTNLLSNAIKFTGQGEIVLAAAAGDAQGDYRFTVSDTGAGFEAVDAERLFARFEQADGSATREHGGLGLGLAICRQLTELMGGAIGATAEPGVGAVFTLTLLLPDAEGLDAGPRDEGEAHDLGDAHLRVLVTDDNATNRMVAELIMASIGAEVVCAENGREALEAVEHSLFDVVLMDLQMPVMDGLAAIRAIREREAACGLSRLPVVVVSANVMREQLDASAAAGADDHLGKPVRAEELIAAVTRVVQSTEHQTRVRAHLV